MTPDLALFLVVMSLLVTGTRLAMVRPANWFPVPRQEDIPPRASGLVIVATAVVTLAVAAPVVSGRFPAMEPAMPYITAAAIALLAILFTRAATRSWPARAAVGAASSIAGTAWAVAPSWLTYSLAAGFTAVAVITVVRPRASFWAAAAVAGVLAGWDYVQVSVTHATVRAVAAGDQFAGLAPSGGGHGIGIPGLIGIPAHAGMLGPYVVMLGVGDVVLPGMLIVIAGRAGRLAGTGSLYAAAVSGYGAGLAACLTVAAVTGIPFPAMVFLVPGIVIGVVLAARRAGVWPALASAGLHRPAAPRQPEAG
jgi:hypothetical protein